MPEVILVCYQVFGLIDFCHWRSLDKTQRVTKKKPLIFKLIQFVSRF